MTLILRTVFVIKMLLCLKLVSLDSKQQTECRNTHNRRNVIECLWTDSRPLLGENKPPYSMGSM